MAELPMKRRLPPLSWLRAFEASARHLSFTHAANELALTQAAVSKQVKNLEYDLQELLFERRPRSLVLTKVGEAYLPKVKDSFERLAAGTEEVFGKKRAQTLTVRAPVAFAKNWLAPRLSNFLIQHPEKRIRIISSIWNEVQSTNRYDIDIRYGTGGWDGFIAQRLTWDHISPVCSPLTLETHGIQKILRKVPLIHVLGYADGWANWLDVTEFDDIDPGKGLHFDTSLLAFDMAARSNGVAMARSSIVQEDLRLGHLVQPFEQTLAIEEAFYVLQPQSGIVHADAQPFMQWLLDEAMC